MRATQYKAHGVRGEEGGLGSCSGLLRQVFRADDRHYRLRRARVVTLASPSLLRLSVDPAGSTRCRRIRCLALLCLLSLAPFELFSASSPMLKRFIPANFLHRLNAGVRS